MGQFIIRVFGVIGVTIVAASVVGTVVAVATKSNGRR